MSSQLFLTQSSTNSVLKNVSDLILKLKNEHLTMKLLPGGKPGSRKFDRRRFCILYPVCDFPFVFTPEKDEVMNTCLLMKFTAE